MWRPKQKNKSLTKDLVRSSSRPENTVVKFCASTCSTAEACILLDQRRTFVGCDVNSELPTSAEADFVLTFASPVLSKKSDISGSAEVVAAAKVLKVKRAALLASEKASMWEFPLRLDATQILPGDILHLVLSLFEDHPLVEMCSEPSLNVWSLVWRSGL